MKIRLAIINMLDTYGLYYFNIRSARMRTCLKGLRQNS